MNSSSAQPIPARYLPIRTLELALLALILTLAALLRLGHPGIVEFKQDEANISLMALDFARGRSFPLLGIDSSVGIRNAPMSIYLLAPPYLLTSDPVIATQYVGLLNVIAVLLTYVLARRYYGSLAGLVAALLFTVAPWAVMFSRKLWAQELLPLFVLLTILTGLLGFVEDKPKRWAQLWHLPLLAITAQIHYGTFALFPITLYMVMVGRKAIRQTFWLSIPIAALLCLPYAIGMAGELRSGRLTGAFSTPVNSQPRTLIFSPLAFQYTAQTIGGVGLAQFVRPLQDQPESALYSALSAAPEWPLYAVAIGVTLSAIWLTIRALRKRHYRSSPVDLVMILWLIGTPIAFSLNWTPVFTHYLIPLFPAAFIVLGAGFSALASRLRPALRALPVIALIGIATWQIMLVTILLGGLDAGIRPADFGEFGVPLGHLMPIRSEILKQRPVQILGDLGGQYIGFTQEVSIWNVLLYDIPLRRFIAPDLDVYPAEDALLLSGRCESGSRDALVFPRASDDPQQACYTITTRRPADLELTGYTTPPLLNRFANGPRLTTFRWDTGSGCLDLVWRMEGGPARGPESDFFQTSVHLIATSGEKILDADRDFWLGRYWRIGDTVIRRHCLSGGHERIPDIAGARIGLYTFEDTAEGRKFYAVDVIDQSGASVGQQVEIRFR